MSVKILQHIKDALGNLDPNEIRRHTERPVRLFLYGNNQEAHRQMEDFFAPPHLSDAKRRELFHPREMPRFATTPHHRQTTDEHRHAHARWYEPARSRCSRAQSSSDTSAQMRFA